jgi:hypothetical protein
MELRFDNINHINKRYIKAASTVTFIAELLNITSQDIRDHACRAI